MSEKLYGPLADQIARRHGLDPRLFRRLISQESGWRADAVSPAGARGLTQVVPKWHPKANLSTPKGQLEYGASHLASLLKKYGNPRDALSTYNSGRPWSVGKGIPETNNYVNSILTGYQPAQTPGAGVPPAPAPGGAPAQAPRIDGARLLALLSQTSRRALAGQMPSPAFGRQLGVIARDASRAPTVPQVQEAVAPQGAPTFGGLTMGGGPSAHGSRALGNWQSDNAYDLMGKAGDAVPAMVSGVVTKISGKPGGDPGFAGYGITVRTKNGDLFFKHLGTANVKVGQRITPQTILGTLDPSTAGGPHLHLGGTNRGFIDRLAKLYTRK